MPNATLTTLDATPGTTAGQISIAINGRFLSRRVTGVERYAREVCARLGPARTIRPASGDGIVGHLWEQAVLPARIAAGDLLWSPANTGPLALSRQVVTIHDVSVIDHPEWFDSRFAAWYRWLLPRLARRVRRVITLSEFSKSRIVATMGISGDRVVVVACGVDRARFGPLPPASIEAVVQRHRLLQPYVIAVGSLEPRKNLDILCRAWPRVHSIRHDVQLVIVGDWYRSFKRSAGARLSSVARVIRSASDEDLRALYCGARALVMPSLYEGFGLPALEAMACGVPVIASRETALPEVVGDAAVMIDPRDPNDIADAIAGVLTDERRSRDLGCRGRQRAERFTWERTAAAVRTVLREAADR
jgi:glycosyltransferase involved in cell wall biosynthesis